MGSGSSEMQDAPDTQPDPDDDIDEEWPINDPEEHLGLPVDIALTLSGSMSNDTCNFGKRSRALWICPHPSPLV